MASLVLLLLSCCSMAATASVIRSIPLSYPALYPESFAWDDRLGLFISGSIIHGSLFTFSDNGNVQEFIRDDAYAGKAATVGVILDNPRRRVLVVVRNVLNHSSSFDALAAYNIDTKERVFLARLEKEGVTAGPNDVTVDPSGNAYVTDSTHNILWKVTPEGEVSVFTDSPVLKSQPVVAVESPAARFGLNGAVVTEQGKALLAVQTNTGKLFKVSLVGDAREVEVVEMDKLLVAADGLAIRQDGTVVVVSTESLWALTSKDGWKSAHVIHEIPFDRSLNTTTVALRGSGDRIFVIQTHFHDLSRFAKERMTILPGGGFREEFSVQEIQLVVTDSDESFRWMLLIPVMAMVLFYGSYRLQDMAGLLRCRTKTD